MTLTKNVLSLMREMISRAEQVMQGEGFYYNDADIAEMRQGLVFMDELLKAAKDLFSCSSEHDPSPESSCSVCRSLARMDLAITDFEGNDHSDVSALEEQTMKDTNDLPKSLHWLVRKWRARATALSGSSWNSPNGHGDISQRETYKQCANEIAMLLNEDSNHDH